MAFIEPNSRAWILTGVPLDKGYTHTYFPWVTSGTPTRETQFNAFISNYLRSDVSYKGKSYSYALTKYSFLRHNRNSIRIKMPIELLYDCNYIIFENTGYNYSENDYKKFYAFIDDVKYINDNVTEVLYTIDVMQTWHFDYSLDPCFVEREHSETDVRGENLLDESVGTGEYVCYEQTKLLDLDNEDWYILFVLTFDAQTALRNADGRFTCGNWNQCEYWKFKVTNRDPNNPDTYYTPSEINNAIQTSLGAVTIFNRQNGIVNMYMCPYSLLPNFNNNLSFENSMYYAQVGSDIDISLRPSYGNWIPHNNKLLTYPYCYFTIDNGQGITKDFKYEYFKDCKTGNIQSGDMLFREFCNNAVKQQVRIVPINYLYDGTGNAPNFDYSIDLTDFAIGTWATNDLLAKVVQGGIGLAMTAAFGGSGSGIGSAISTIAGNIRSYPERENYNAEAVHKYLTDVMENPYEHIEAPELIRPEQIDTKSLSRDMVKTAGAISILGMRSNAVHSIGNGNINMSDRNLDFIAKAWRMDDRIARKIDNYFDMYGYKVNELKIPNRSSRPYFNYVKTTSCKLHNELIPQDAIKKIEDIYNNGITFWKDIQTVGNYQYAINGLNVPGGV